MKNGETPPSLAAINIIRCNLQNGLFFEEIDEVVKILNNRL